MTDFSVAALQAETMREVAASSRRYRRERALYNLLKNHPQHDDLLRIEANQDVIVKKCEEMGLEVNQENLETAWSALPDGALSNPNKMLFEQYKASTERAYDIFAQSEYAVANGFIANEANRSIILGHAKGQIASVDEIQYIFDRVKGQLILGIPPSTKEEIIERMVAVHDAGDPEPESNTGVRKQNSITYRRQLETMSREVLLARETQQKETTRMRRLSKAELKSEIRQSKPDTSADPVPVSLKNPDGSPMTARDIKKMSLEDYGALLHFPNKQPRPGVAEAVNKILNSK